MNLRRWLGAVLVVVAVFAVVVGVTHSRHKNPSSTDWVAAVNQRNTIDSASQSNSGSASGGSANAAGVNSIGSSLAAGASSNTATSNTGATAANSATSNNAGAASSQSTSTSAVRNSSGPDSASNSSGTAVKSSTSQSGASKLGGSTSSSSSPSKSGSSTTSKSKSGSTSSSGSSSSGSSNSGSSGSGSSGNTNQPPTATPPAGTFTVVVSENKGAQLLEKKVLQIHTGENLMQYMQQNFQIQTAYGGDFMLSINGIKSLWTDVPPSQRQPVDWFLYLNGQEAPVGASSVTPQAGDVETWDYHRWDPSTGKG